MKTLSGRIEDERQAREDYVAKANERFSIIEQRLLILHRDLEMESVYPELKEAFDHYNKLLSELQTIKTLSE